MQQTLGTRLRLVSWCHLTPVRVKLPHVPFDPALFPAAKEGFEDFSMAPHVCWFGGKLALLDISGLTRAEVAESQDGHHAVEAIRFLQCLEWIQKGNYRDKFDFDRIVAYVSGGEPAVAVRTNDGFKRVPYPGDEIPWPPGTLGLFFIDSL